MGDLRRASSISRLCAPANGSLDRRDVEMSLDVSARDGQVAIDPTTAIDMQRGADGRHLVDAGEELFGDSHERPGCLRTWSSLNHWDTAVTGLSHLWVQRDLPQEWGLGHGGDFRASASAEDFVPFAAAVANEVALVLDDAEDGNADLLRHRDRLVNVLQR